MVLFNYSWQLDTRDYLYMREHMFVCVCMHDDVHVQNCIYIRNLYATK